MKKRTYNVRSIYYDSRTNEYLTKEEFVKRASKKLTGGENK